MTVDISENMDSGDNPTKAMPDSEEASVNHTVILDAPRELGAYRLTQMLGRGGMGEVWQAFDTQLERKVAIKLMRPELLSNQDATRRFAREARAVARLNHPNIVHVYALGDDGGLTYFVMELVEGETVTQRLKRVGQLGLSEALHIIMQAVEGLSYAYARGIIHRDIKPSNLMLTGEDRVKIADFGLAKMVEHDSQMTAAGTAMGSPNYMSPEQARGEEADHRSDIYALGISLYQMLCDALPFTAHSPLSVLMKQIQDPLPEHASLKALCNDEACGLLKKMTAKKPADRFQSYEELAAAVAVLQPALAGKGAHGITASMPVSASSAAESGVVPILGSQGQQDGRLTAEPFPVGEPSVGTDKSGFEPERESADVEPPFAKNSQVRRFIVPGIICASMLVLALVFALVWVKQHSAQTRGSAGIAENTSADTAPSAAITPGRTVARFTPASSSPASQLPSAVAVAPPGVTPVSGAVGGTPASQGFTRPEGMQPVQLSAVATPHITPFPGVPTTITPLPDVSTMTPALRQIKTASNGSTMVMDSHGAQIGSIPAGTTIAAVRTATLDNRKWYVIRYNQGEGYIPTEQTQAADNLPSVSTPAPVSAQSAIYVLGTAGAPAGEQVPVFLDNKGKTLYKSFSAGTTVTVITAEVSMLRARVSDGKMVYVYKKMASKK